MTEATHKIGEWTTEAPVTEDMENMCIEVAKQAGVHFDVFIPKTYRVLELCGGTNYLVKVKVGDKCLHVMICQAFYMNKVTEGSEPTVTEGSEPTVTEGSEPTVTGVQFPKEHSAPLVPFKHV